MEPEPVQPQQEEPKAPVAASSKLPWLEKYRPTLIKDIVGNNEAVARLQVIAEEGNMPNLILSDQHTSSSSSSKRMYPGSPRHRQDHLHSLSSKPAVRTQQQGGGAGAECFG
eukprot:1151666-Pelagomonas_calceolata.AAC.3